MLYGVVMVVVSPLAAALAINRQRMEWLVGAGPAAVGPGHAAADGRRRMSAGSSSRCSLIGLGQALSIAAQSALVREHCDAEVSGHGRARRLTASTACSSVWAMRSGRCWPRLLLMTFGYRIGFVATGGCGCAVWPVVPAGITRRRSPTHAPALATRHRRTKEDRSMNTAHRPPPTGWPLSSRPWPRGLVAVGAGPGRWRRLPAKRNPAGARSAVAHLRHHLPRHDRCREAASRSTSPRARSRCRLATAT